MQKKGQKPKIDFSKGIFNGGNVAGADPIDLEVVAPDLDASHAIALFDQHSKRIEAMHEVAVGFEYTDDDAQAKGTAMANNAQKAVKEMNGLSTKLIKPYKDLIDKIVASKNMYVTRLQAIVELFRAKDQMYSQVKAMRAREEAEKRRREAEKVQAQLKKQADQLGIEPPVFNMPQVAPAAPAPVRTSKGSSYQKEDIEIKIVDESKIPRKYLQPVMSRIKTDAKAGKQIPGVEWKLVKKTIYRTA